MYAISLLQPWASLTVMGAKTIETRSWSTRYRGTLVIHASKGKAGEPFCKLPAFKKYIDDFKALPCGAFIGMVNLEKIIRTNEVGLNDELMNALTYEEKAFGDYSSDRYAWILKDPAQFIKPIAARGMPGLWKVDPELLTPR